MKVPLLVGAVAMSGLYLAVVLALYLGQRAIIYPAPRGPASIPSGFEKVTLHTADGLALTAAWRPAKSGRHTVLFFHGNGDSLPGAAAATEGLVKAGYGVLLADYRGYADNPGKPTEEGLALDAEAALDFANRRGIAANRIVLMGASLGTGVAAELATKHSPAALVLISPFTSLPDVTAAAVPWAPVRRLMLDRFDSRTAIARVKAPILVLHAADDRVIPLAQGEALAQAAPHARFIRFEQGGHQIQFARPTQTAIVGWLKGQDI
ncbi:MAG: alpha/beta hydrolase [Novosphingobium sp.]|uniref:alpha/beta hydrolase n=1 Tax=Novosphingobium sp. TaxID=1874826 RepID=UPI0012CA4294|nr:alpha/beta hydrolase [Novosphingobium sp.]MPS71164.1 alpha/beta hydrolase [Novosphingobium sp.]